MLHSNPMKKEMLLKDFYYYLPRELIAQYPSPVRDKCRLLVLSKKGKIEHRKFYEIGEYLRKGDVIVLNNTRVIPARLKGKKETTGGGVEIFLLQKKEDGSWECLLRPARRLKEGTVIIFPGTHLSAKVLKKGEQSKGVVELTCSSHLKEEILKAGQVPLPPYIKRPFGPVDTDKEKYQTIYAVQEGAIAAPTAGLHFTHQLLQKLKSMGIKFAEITLHTGWASFKFLSNPIVEKNEIPPEYFKISPSTAKIINETKKKGGRIIAVGTTTVRALETQTQPSGLLLPGKGWTNLFIYPGYNFKLIDTLVTNFHIPGSSLILLVSAFVGREKLMAAYEEAIKKGYRFLSFGDAMLII